MNQRLRILYILLGIGIVALCIGLALVKAIPKIVLRKVGCVTGYLGTNRNGLG